MCETFRHNKDGLHPVDQGWRDIGCSDFKRAARNRVIIANGQFVEYFEWLDEYLSGVPTSKPLPAQLLGDLPKAGGDGSQHVPFTVLPEGEEEY